MTHRPFIVGNWKMNGTRAMLAEARAIDRAAERFPDVQVALAPPFTLINTLREAVSAMNVGGQDCHAEVKGAHTGDVSAAMLADIGADFVILGHSERRRDHGETAAAVRAKADAALTAGLAIIVCVGETLEERDAGKAEAVVSGQVSASLPVGDEAQAAAAAGKIAVAYEPVWAIGTGRVAAVEDVVAMHAAVRAAERGLWRGGGQGAHSLWRLGQRRQRGGFAVGGRRGWRAGGRSEPDGGSVPADHRRRGVGRSLSASRASAGALPSAGSRPTCAPIVSGRTSCRFSFSLPSCRRWSRPRWSVSF
jgi:triosephosphate isomerase